MAVRDAPPAPQPARMDDIASRDNDSSSARASPIPPEAQRRIEELEAQVKILTLRATTAVERATDLEDALRTLTSRNPTSPPHRPSTANGYKPTPNGIPPTPYIAPQQLPIPAAPPTTRTSLSRLLPLRRAASTATVPPPGPSTAPLAHLIPYNPTPPPSASLHHQQQQQQQQQAPPHIHPQSATLPPTQDLVQALETERGLRVEAERKVEQSQQEVEELTGQLFQEANQMVADERRARAKAEERVRELEGRGRRIEVLEGRLGRIERLRRLVGEGERDGVREGAVGEKARGLEEGKVSERAGS